MYLTLISLAVFLVIAITIVEKTQDTKPNTAEAWIAAIVVIIVELIYFVFAFYLRSFFYP